MSRLEFPLAQGWSRGLTLVFADALESGQLQTDDFFHVDQVHGADIYTLSQADLSRRGPLAKADGLYARGSWIKDSKRALLIKTADCVPLFLIDRQSEAICALHAGWRGLQKGLHRQPFERKWFDPKFTWAWIGPSLNGRNFEVGQDMWSQFLPKVQQDEALFSQVPSKPEKRYFHAWKFLEQELKTLGVDLVYNVEIDTFEDESFASYRRAKTRGLSDKTRNLSWIGTFC